MSYKENAFPVGKGKLNLTTGTIAIAGNPRVLWCRVAGTLTITWSDATTTVISLGVGEAVEVEATATSVAITTGTFHVN